MLELSSSVLEEVSTGLERVRRAAVGDIGQLSLSFTPTISHETLPALLDQVERNAPGLDLRVSEMWQADSVEAVRTGRLDAGLARHPELPPELDSINIRDEPLGVVVARTHPLADRTALDPSELTDSTLFIWPRDFSPGFFDQVVGFYRANGFDGAITEMRLLSRGSFLSDRTAHQAIKAGAAFSVSFEHEHDAMPEDLVWRPAHPGPLIGVHLYWRRPATPAVHRLADLALQLSKARSWL